MTPTTADSVAALVAELTRQGIELTPHGERLRYRPKAAMTPELAARIKAHKPELLTALATRPVTVGERFHGGDVQVGKERLPIGVRKGDEDPPLTERDRVGVPNLVCVPAGQVKTERLEGVPSQQLSNLVRIHTRSIPSADGKGQALPETHADREIRRFLAVCRPWPDGRGWYDPTQTAALVALARAAEPPPAPRGAATRPDCNNHLTINQK